MKEIIIKYIEYLERKRKSRDLWKLLQQEQEWFEYCLRNASEYAREGNDHQTGLWQRDRITTDQRMEKLKNQIKLL